MPYYDLTTGIMPYTDDACRNCDLIGCCNIIGDFSMNHDQAQYNEKHIVPIGQASGRPNYVECQSYRIYIPPDERPDRNPEFGTRLSQQEVDLMSNPTAPYPDHF